MTRPTAPCLTADYYTYSTYSQRDDYYGELDSKILTSAPLREEPIHKQLKRKSSKAKRKIYAITHCISSFYCFLSISFIVFNCIMYYNGIRNKFILYSSAAFTIVALTSILMHIGIILNQPFTCIPFVVLRTLEAFICTVSLGGFTYALIESESDVFMFFLQCTKIAADLFSAHRKIDLADATLQLCFVGCCLSMAILSLNIYVCRVSFKCIMSVADQLRRNRQANTSQTRFTGDEFYYS